MKTQAQAETNPAQYHSPWPRRMLILIIVLLPFGLLFQGFIYLRMAGSGEVAQALEEADRLDPGWRIEDIEAHRRVVPDAENSALIVRAVAGIEQRGSGLLPDGWPDKELESALYDLTPEVQLNENQLKMLRDELTKAAAGLKEIRRVEDKPNGRFPLNYTPNPWTMLLPHVQGIRRCAVLLKYDAMLSAQDGKIDAALRSCRTAINTTRSLGDEPLIISMLVRIAGRSITMQCLERLLAQGTASAESLATLQKMLESEAAEPLFLNAFRGERALAEKGFEAMENGEISAVEVMKLAGALAQAPGTPADNQPFAEVFSRLLLPVKIGPIKTNRAALLRFNNQLVEIARKPSDDQDAEIKKLESTANDMPLLARAMVMAIGKVHDANRHDQTALRSAITALAAERFRLKHGRWPGSLAELTPELLAAVPKDPYLTGSLLKLAKKPDGIVIYSVARNGVDDGGNLDRKKGGFAKDADLGFQLWDVAKRRQPAVPVPIKPTDDKKP